MPTLIFQHHPILTPPLNRSQLRTELALILTQTRPKEALAAAVRLFSPTSSSLGNGLSAGAELGRVNSRAQVTQPLLETFALPRLRSSARNLAQIAAIPQSRGAISPSHVRRNWHEFLPSLKPYFRLFVGQLHHET